MSLPEIVNWWLNLAAMLGIAVLSVPAWSLNSRKKKLQAVQAGRPGTERAFRDRVKRIVFEKRTLDVSQWRRIDEICLAVGYLLLLGSAVARLFLPLL